MIIDETLEEMMKYLSDYIHFYIENNEALQKENAELRARVNELGDEVARLVNMRTICVEEELSEYLKYDKPLPGGTNE